MANNTRNHGVTLPRDEFVKRKAKLVRSGVPSKEAEARLRQAAEDRYVGLMQARGKALHPSLKTEIFRPNYKGKIDNARKRIVDPKFAEKRARDFAAEIRFKHQLDERKNRVVEQKALEKAFRQHPKEANAIRSHVLKKTEEEKHKKKQRREMARELTGSKKGDWWDPIVKMGSDLLPKLLPLLIGMGDYTDQDSIPIKTGEVPSSNSFLAATSGGHKGYEVPFMHTHGEKTRVSHREYVGDIYSSTLSYAHTEFALNPGMQELFPWLAPVANQYTNYRLLGAVVDFVSQGSDYANVAGLGYVALATQYNALAPLFQDKRELLNYEFADACKPSLSMTHWIECKPNDVPDPEKTVRAGTIPANADLRLYDHGRLTVAVGGNTAGGSIIGQLWITYDIEFYFPRYSGSAAGVLNSFGAILTGCTPALPLGTGETDSVRNTMSILITPTTLTPGSVVDGSYFVTMCWTGAASSNNAAPSVTATGADCVVSGLVVSAGVLGGLNYFLSFYLLVTGVNSQVTIGTAGTAIPAAPCTCYFNFNQVPLPPTLDRSDIFDPLGKEADLRYDSFMEGVKLKELTSMGLLKGDPPKKGEKVKILEPTVTTMKCDRFDKLANEEQCDFDVFRKVGKYGYCHAYGATFVTENLDSDSPDWWFLNVEKYRVDELFDEHYEDFEVGDFVKFVKLRITNDKDPDSFSFDFSKYRKEDDETAVCEFSEPIKTVIRDFDSFRVIQEELDGEKWLSVQRPVEKHTLLPGTVVLDVENPYDSAFIANYAGMSGPEFRTIIQSIFARRAKIEAATGKTFDRVMRKRDAKITNTNLAEKSTSSI